MRSLRPCSIAAICLSVVTASALALSPNERLLRMVPPNSPEVAGFRAPTEERSAKYYMVITLWNRLDLDDFLALTGADPERRIHEAVFVSGALDEDEWGTHSLLVQGTFNPEMMMLRLPDGTRVRRHTYRNIPVLVVQPFERERKYLKEVRWLALLDSHFAVFGTIDSVKQEVDRDLDGSSVDSSLTERLSRLNTKNGTWSIVADAKSVTIMTSTMDRLDSKLGRLASFCQSMQIGIQLNGRARLEYEFEVSGLQLERQKPAIAPKAPAVGLSFLNSPTESPATRTARAAIVRGVLKISRDRYERWLADVDMAVMQHSTQVKNKLAHK
jgi:hypothetical protein